MPGTGEWGYRGLLGLLACAVLAAGQLAYAGDEAQGVDYVPTVLVTGANKGIGLEFARQYAARGARVIATARDPAAAADLNALAAANSRVTVEKLDVTDFAAIDALASRYQGTPIDLLINNAGISGGSQNQMFGKLRFDVYEEVLRVNTLGPLKMAEAFMPHVMASRDKRLVSVSSSEGSINGVDSARLYFYRASKAALNMEMKNLAYQVKSKGVAVGLVNPGMTDTDLMKGLPKKMLRPPADAARDMMRSIDTLTVENTGSFWQYDGTIIPW
jgi:NAD(P)-dependent dehydrogenase (short-subunit alcohol dehydrogenase family)